MYVNRLGKSGAFGKLVFKILGGPDAVIRLAESTPPDHDGFESKQALVLPNCLSDEEILTSLVRENRRDAKGRMSLLFVGLHSEDKGVLVAIQAVANALANGADVELHTIGLFNDKEFERKCRDYLTHMGCEDRVIFHGARFGRDKLDIMAKCSTLIFPTTFPCEALPLVVMEAMASGMSVIASRWSGIPSLIREGVDGVLTNPGSVEQSVQGIVHLFNHPEIESDMGNSGRTRFTLNFSKEAYRIAVNQVLTSCLK